MTDFVHLHVHSDFSLLDGAASVENLAAKAASLGMKHLAITDHGNMFGVLNFVEACLGSKEHPLQHEPVHPIVGSEFYMAPGSRFEKSGSEHRNKYFHLVLLAADEEGYRNLMKLSSYSFTEGFYHKPRIDEELLTRYHRGLICLSACIAGEIPSLVLDGNVEAAEKRALWFASLFGKDNFYLELQDHRLPAQKTANAALIAMSRRTGIPLVITNDVHYLERADAQVQDILLCISTNKKRNEAKRMRFDTDEFYFKTGDEMAALFPDCPEAIANTLKIAERCRTVIPAPGLQLPDFDIPPGYADGPAYLRALTLEGLEKRYPGRAGAVLERAEYELGVIISMGFTGYFLIVADFINWAKAQGIPVGPGRGSGAGSIVAYALRITDIDPLKYNLLFERFLNPERISMPDFDVDFCFERRGEVINYVTQKYGKERVGQIITFAVLKAKAVIKDVARALDISLDESNRITKLIPGDPKMTLAKALDTEPKLREVAAEEAYRELFDLARRLEGKNRHNSVHAAGVVIGRSDLSDFVPLFSDPRGEVTASQYTMDKLEACGLVKMDFLGLKTLTLIKHTEDLIRERGGEYAGFNVADVDEHDEATFRMLGEGKSAGVFQFESEGMQSILKQAKPDKIEDLIALNALYRPGPMQYIGQFIDSKWGRQAIEYPDPCLEDILRETYGVIVYQEQVMQVAQRVAGYSLGQADILRRAMGKKKREILDQEKVPFIAGAVRQGFKERDADRIFELLAPFAGYGFNKSHAAAYSLLAYQTAYLKANFPGEFMAANLTNEISSVDKLPEYIAEARKMGVPIDPPDINRSGSHFTVVEGRIVYGFLGIKGLGDASAAEIVFHRQDGPYKSFMDFLERVNIKTVGKSVIDLLVRTGAFDGFGMTRACLAQNLERAVEYAQNKKEDKKYGQSSLFEDSGEKEYPDFDFDPAGEWDQGELLRIEKELIGFYFSAHPMDAHREAWENGTDLDLSQIEKAPDGNYTLAGIIKALRTHLDKNGREMCFASLEDYRGEVDLVFFSKTWETCKTAIVLDKIAALKGRLDRSGDKKRDRPSIIVNAVLDIDTLAKTAPRKAAKPNRPGVPGAPAAKAAGGNSGRAAGKADNKADGKADGTPEYRELHIRLVEKAAVREETLYPLLGCLEKNAGSCPVYIHVPIPEGETVIRAAPRIAAEPTYMDALTRYEAVADVWGA
ncbi:MAG: DNA polymerase III subunit alpha [Spirochaetaceae bacterium]|jgi:DNA polymerase-3 subunit alpha|nr:DNA polymerase III subunit alpha [Spirochaetaceae bacterium]